VLKIEFYLWYNDLAPKHTNFGAGINLLWQNFQIHHYETHPFAPAPTRLSLALLSLWNLEQPPTRENIKSTSYIAGFCYASLF
jgi:hypothetical protein